MRQKQKHSLPGRILRFLLIKLPLGLVVFSLLWVLILKWIPVTVTPLMLFRTIEYRQDDDFHIHRKWRKLERISPELAKAVIASEDNLFGDHNGFDWNEMRKAVDEHRQNGKRLRGASTISQQTAKNVFLLPNRSFFRKGLEAYFTVLIEWIWGKERIMEVYLNVIEMGKGLFGAEAAAEVHFGKTAEKLTRQESCLIAACLPNPYTMDAGRPSSYVIKRSGQIKSLEDKLIYPDFITPRH